MKSIFVLSIFLSPLILHAQDLQIHREIGMFGVKRLYTDPIYLLPGCDRFTVQIIYDVEARGFMMMARVTDGGKDFSIKNGGSLRIKVGNDFLDIPYVDEALEGPFAILNSIVGDMQVRSLATSPVESCWILTESGDQIRCDRNISTHETNLRKNTEFIRRFYNEATSNR